MIQTETFEDEIDLKPYFDLIQTYKWFLIGAAFIGFTVTAVFFKLQTPVFRASCDIAIEKHTNTNSLFYSGDQRLLDIQTHLVLLQSQRLLTKVASKMDLKQKFPKGTSDAKIIETLNRMIAVSEKAPYSNVITIAVTGPNPKFIAVLANLIAETYIQQDIDDTLYLSKKINEKITSTDETKNKLNSDDQEVTKDEIINSLPIIVRDDVLNSLRSKKIEIANKIRELTPYYKDKYPPLVLLNETSASLDKEMSKRVQIILSSFKLGAAEGLMPIPMKIISYATIPTEPLSGKQVKTTILITFLCPLALFGSIIFFHSIHKTVKTAKDLKNVLFLGFLPKFKNSITDIQNIPVNIKEAFASIRTSLLFCMSQSYEKCVLVSSALPSEGKTTIAALLGISMAQAGIKVILIGADMRKPQISQLFKLPSDAAGFSDYLLRDLEEKDVVLNGSMPNLDIITSGSSTGEPSDLLSLGLGKVQGLIENLKANYDKIVIDSPSILMGISDVPLLSKFADHVILVARFGKTEIHNLQKAEQQLKNVGAGTISAVINFSSNY